MQCGTVVPASGCPILPLLLRRLEITQIGRCLILLGRHQEPIPALEIVFLADDDLGVVLGIIKLGPFRTQIRIVHVSFVHSPRLRQSMVDRCDFVMKDIRIGLVAVDALLEDRLIESSGEKTPPLTPPVGIFRPIERLGASDRPQYRGQTSCGDRASGKHDYSP